MANVVPHATLVRTLHSQALRPLLPKLMAYAARRLREAGLSARGEDAEDVMQSALMLALRGTRKPWTDDRTLLSYLCGIAWSWVAYLRRRALTRNESDLEDPDALRGPASRRDDKIDARDFVAELEDELVGDEEMEALFALIADSQEKMTRQKQADALRWDLLTVDATHKRLKRRYDAVRLRRMDVDHANPEREGSPGDPAAPGRRPGRRAVG